MEAQEERLFILRRNWLVDRKAKWWSAGHPPPQGWNPAIQLQTAGLAVLRMERV